MKILVVDDSKAMRSIVIRTLRQAGFDGHVIQEATDGKNALEVMNSYSPDLVLTDWNMPEMLGIDLIRAVRAKGNMVPFVFITSEGTEEIHKVALGEGAQAVITKPFSAEKFQEKLSGVIQ